MNSLLSPILERKCQLTGNVPADIDKGQTIHIILKVKDSGSPQLIRFARVIVTAK